MSVDGKPLHLGLFDNVESAKAAYKYAKEAEAYRWYERLKAGEFAVEDKVIECMKTWTHKEII